MPTYEQRLEAMHASPEYKALDKEGKAKWDLGLFQQVREESRTQGEAGLKKNVEQFPRMGPVANALGAFSSGAGQTASAEYGAPGGAAMANLVPGVAGGGRGLPDILGEQDAMAAQNPMATAAGKVAGAFIGPISSGLGAVAQGAGNLGRAAFGMGALELTFGKRLLSNLIANTVGGTAAVGTYEAAKYHEMPGISERLADAAYGVGAMATNPLALGLLGAGSAAQAKFLRPRTAENASAIDHFERATGKKVPIEVLTDSADQRAAYDAMARTPGVQDRIEAQRKNAIGGLKQMLEDLREGTGAEGGGREALRGRAAKTVQKMVGTDEPSPITAERSAKYKAGVAPYAAPELERTQLLSNAVNAIRKERVEGAVSSLDGIFDEINALAKAGKGIPAQSLEEFRQRVQGLGRLIPTNQAAAEAGSRTTAEAGKFFAAITETAQRTAPDYANALTLSSKLHKMEDALGEVPISHIDDKQAAAFFRAGTDFPSRWQALQANADPKDVAALKGWYWYRLVRAVANGRNWTINPERLDQTLAREDGAFNSQIVETVLGKQVINNLRDHAEFSTKLFGKGRFGAEGSSTAGRISQYTTQLASAGAAAAAIHLIGSLSDPFSATATLLGPVAVRAALRSAMGGLIENQLQQGARMGAQPAGMGANALSQGLQQAPQPLGIPPRPGLITSLNQGGSQ